MKLIESGEILDLKYVKFDRKRKTGGEVKSIRAVITKTKELRDSTKVDGIIATQNHYAHFTRNMYQCMGDEITSSIRKIHCLLLMEVNGMKVML